ncbi:MAG TPA: glycoside hydrolase family 15 protein [Flavisolibacter sp.]|nr:glycoside hydrolase family 15 protein [Flavisolibacter sp.]
MMNSLQLRDYALIGNSRAAALVSKYGSVDWCCLPEFHSPAIFSALLDRNKGGHFSICPTEEYQSFQNYIPDTNVVETVFRTKSGEVRLTDAFVALTEVQKTQSLFPDHELLRVIKAISGTVRLKMEYAPAIFYGAQAAELKNNKNLGIKCSWKEGSFILQSTLQTGQFKVEKDYAFAFFQPGAGEDVIFSLSYSNQGPAILPELNTTARNRMDQTIRFWKSWIAQCRYEGVYKEQVRRSALVLKLLAHAPSGSIIAAPTTSLPEEIGGERNWDYRFCWLRDASFTVKALIRLGFEQEAHAYMNWILHATQLTQPKLQVVYSVYGQARLKEQNLGWLEGFKKSKPVRIGNGAYNQFQLDVYGEVLDAFYLYSGLIKKFDRKSRKFMLGLGKVICQLWNQPDNGIWELRSSTGHHTHSKVMAWVGLDRLIKLITKYQWNVRTEEYEKIRQAIRAEVERFGFNKNLNSYTRKLRDDSLDASSLVFSLVEYCPASSPAMLSTVDQIWTHLSKNNMIYRYRDDNDGLSGSEGCFGICSFWLAENLAKSGRVKEAVTVFETMLEQAGPAGLLSEEVDPVSHELLGNYPQGFTHIGLINAALSINEAFKKKEQAHERQ